MCGQAIHFSLLPTYETVTLIQNFFSKAFECHVI